MADSIARILNAALAAHDVGGDICERCLGPRRCAGWLVLEGDAEPALCEACGRPVHTDGRSAVSPGDDGRPVVHTLQLIRAESCASSG